MYADTSADWGNREVEHLQIVRELEEHVEIIRSFLDHWKEGAFEIPLMQKIMDVAYNSTEKALKLCEVLEEW